MIFDFIVPPEGFWERAYEQSFLVVCLLVGLALSLWAGWFLIKQLLKITKDCQEALVNNTNVLNAIQSLIKEDISEVKAMIEKQDTKLETFDEKLNKIITQISIKHVKEN